jgi:hypothetical protein
MKFDSQICTSVCNMGVVSWHEKYATAVLMSLHVETWTSLGTIRYLLLGRYTTWTCTLDFHLYTLTFVWCHWLPLITCSSQPVIKAYFLLSNSEVINSSIQSSLSRRLITEGEENKQITQNRGLISDLDKSHWFIWRSTKARHILGEPTTADHSPARLDQYPAGAGFVVAKKWPISSRPLRKNFPKLHILVQAKF